MTYNVVALIGESGSGKDRMMRELLSSRPEFHKITNCTSRPIRENETKNTNYFFLSKEQFQQELDEFIEFSIFNDWYYGTRYKDLSTDKINVGVFNPNSIRQMINNPKINLLVFRITCSDRNRLIRQLSREENPNIEEILRRYQTDKIDFSNLDFTYQSVLNQDFSDIQKSVKKIDKYIQQYFLKGQKKLRDLL